MKTYLQSKSKLLCSNVHLYVILLVLFSLSYFNKPLIIALIIYIYYLCKKNRSMKFIIVLFLISSVSLFVRTSNKELENNNYKVSVISVQRKDDYYKNICLIGLEKAVIYTNNKYESGDTIYLEGNSKKLDTGSYEGDFSFKDYLYSHNIKYNLKITNINKVEKGYGIFTFREKIMSFYSNRLELETKNYFLDLIFQENTFDEDFTNNIRSLGISHIFAISGMHVSLLITIITYLLERKGMETKVINNILILCILFYCYLSLFTVSLLRVFLVLLFTKISDKLDLSFTTLDILSLTFIVLFLINPYYSKNIGFVLSYLMTFIIRITEQFYKSKSKIVNLYRLTLLCMLFSFPVIINLNHEVSFITLLITPIISFLFAALIYPLTLINIFLFPISYIGNNIFRAFDYLINIMEKINIFKIRLPYLNIYLIIIYYGIIIYLIVKVIKKQFKVRQLLVMIVYIFILNNIIVLKPYTSVTFIDCGDGDATLIELANNKGNILIDVNDCTYDFLRSKNIKRIDYMILTHSHSDHIFDAVKILNNIPVTNTIVSRYDIREDLNEIISLSNNVYYFKSENFINYENIRINFIGPINKSDSLNDISLCMIVYIKKYKLLFTGDAEVSLENDMVTKYKDELKSDIYQVGHHGSDTSSSVEFINMVNPSVSIISCDLNSIHGFPKQETLTTLKYSKIYKTYLSGNIKITLKDDSYVIKTFK